MPVANIGPASVAAPIVQIVPHFLPDAPVNFFLTEQQTFSDGRFRPKTT